MVVYYLRRRSGDIAMADLRSVRAYEEAQEGVVMHMSRPIAEREYAAVEENLIKGINKKINDGIGERHGIALLLAPVLSVIVSIILISLLNINLSKIDLLILLFTMAVACSFITVSFLQNQKSIKKTRDSYANKLKKKKTVCTEEMDSLEKYYDSLYEYDLKTLATLLAEGKLKIYGKEPSIAFLLALECYILDCNKMVHRYAKILSSSSYNPEREREHIQNDMATGLLDLHLLAFFLGVNKQ
jgi:hypothetical protein